MLYKKIALFCFLFLLAGCGTTRHRYSLANDGAPSVKLDMSKIHDAVPKVESYSRHGNPSSYVVNRHRYYVQQTHLGYDAKGLASWYGTKFDKYRTSSGELYDLYGVTAAHKTLPIPCYARVTNLENGKQIIVKINDRGPFHENRIIDLSYAAAKKIGVTAKGTAFVEVQTIDPRHPTQVASVNPRLIGKGKQKIYLQIGAFTERSHAEQAKERIRQFTSAAITIDRCYLNHHPLYRVHIGPIANVDASDELHHALLDVGLGKPMTVIE